MVAHRSALALFSIICSIMTFGLCNMPIYCSHLLMLNLVSLCPLVQGRIMKHAGDPVAAAALADEARSMDLADRFLNSECVKRMLQADQVFADNTESVCLYVSLE